MQEHTFKNVVESKKLKYCNYGNLFANVQFTSILDYCSFEDRVNLQGFTSRWCYLAEK